MKSLATFLLASTFLFGCQNDSKLDSKGGGGGDLESRVKKLEESNAKYAEALDFLQKVYAQQKAQADSQEREEPAEDAVFAVDVAPDLKGGQVDGAEQRVRDDRGSLGLCLTLLPEGQFDPRGSGQAVRRQGSRRLQEHGRPSAGGDEGAPRGLRRGQAGQVPRVQARLVGEGVRAVRGRARSVEARRRQHPVDREGPEARHREVQDRHGRPGVQARASTATWPSSRSCTSTRRRRFFINGTALRLDGAAELVQERDRRQAEDRRVVGRAVRRLLRQEGHRRGREAVPVEEGPGAEAASRARRLPVPGV